MATFTALFKQRVIHYFVMKIILFCLCLLVTAKSMGKANEQYLLVGSYADSTEAGIKVFRFNIEQGTFTWVSEKSGIQNPSYLTASSDGRFVYSVSEVPAPDAKVCAYAFDKQTGTLTLLNEQSAQGSAPCYIWVDKRNRLVVTANYNGGSISTFPLLEDGTLAPATEYVYAGGTAGSQRQSAPHLHCVYASPDERFLYANDLGTDRIYFYELAESVGKGLTLQKVSPDFFSLPSGEGPRHSIFHPSGKWMYVIGELSGRVTVFAYADGKLSPIQTVEADAAHAAGSADIHTTPDGRFLYVSNRLKDDGIVCFSIDQKSGMLTETGKQATGIHPRNFVITPNGKYLLCACRDSNVIQIFEINPSTGQLKNTGKEIKTAQPVCLKWVETDD